MANPNPGFSLADLFATTLAVTSDTSGESFAELIENKIADAPAGLFVGPRGIESLRSLLRWTREQAGQNLFDVSIVLTLTRLADRYTSNTAVRQRFLALAGNGPEFVNRFIDAPSIAEAENMLSGAQRRADEIPHSLVWSSSARLIHRAKHHQPGTVFGTKVGIASDTDDGAKRLMQEGILCTTCFTREEIIRLNGYGPPKVTTVMSAEELGKINDDGVRNFVISLYAEAQAEIDGNTGRGLHHNARALVAVIAEAVRHEPEKLNTLLKVPTNAENIFRDPNSNLAEKFRNEIGLFFMLAAMRRVGQEESITSGTFRQRVERWLGDGWDSYTGTWTADDKKELLKKMGATTAQTAGAANIVMALVFGLVLGVLLFYGAVTWVGWVVFFAFLLTMTGFLVQGVTVWQSPTEKVGQALAALVAMLLAFPLVFTVLVIFSFAYAAGAVGIFSWANLTAMVVFGALVERLAHVPDAAINLVRSGLATIVRAIPGETSFEEETLANLEQYVMPFRGLGLPVAMFACLLGIFGLLPGVWLYTTYKLTMLGDILLIGILAGWYPLSVLRHGDYSKKTGTEIDSLSDKFAYLNWGRAVSLLTFTPALFFFTLLLTDDVCLTKKGELTGACTPKTPIASWERRLEGSRPAVVMTDTVDAAYAASGRDPKTGEACPEQFVFALKNGPKGHCARNVEDCQRVVNEYPGCKVYMNMSIEKKIGM